MKMLWMLMAMTATTQHVSAQNVQIDSTLNNNNFIHIKQKKSINPSAVCTNFDSSINNWAHPANGESPVSISYVNLWDDASDPKSVKMTVTMSPGYRPQLYDSLYHFIQISPTETYDRFEAEAAADGTVHLTSAEMTMLYSDVNFAAKNAQLEEYCRLQIPTEDIIQDPNNGKLKFTKIVTLNFLKTCAEQKHTLVLKRTANTDANERCKYVTHPSTDLTSCGSSSPNGAATWQDCMKECDASVTCNAFTFDAIPSTCTLYEGQGLNLDNGNFDVTNSANNENCKLKVPSAGTDITAYLLDPHTVQGKCYQYVYDTTNSNYEGQVPARRLAGALTSARQLVADTGRVPCIATGTATTTAAYELYQSGNAQRLFDKRIFALGGNNDGNFYNVGHGNNPQECKESHIRDFGSLGATPMNENLCIQLCGVDTNCAQAQWRTDASKCYHYNKGYNTCYHNGQGTRDGEPEKGYLLRNTNDVYIAGNSYEVRSDGACYDASRDTAQEVLTSSAPDCPIVAGETQDWPSIYRFVGSDKKPVTSTCGTGVPQPDITNIVDCLNACTSDPACGVVRTVSSPSFNCVFHPTDWFDGCTFEAASSGSETRSWTRIPNDGWIDGMTDECYPTVSGYTAPTSAPTTPPPGATSAPTIAATNAPTVPPVAGGQPGATNAPTAAATPPWHTDQTYNDQRLQIDFVVTSVQCKCPTGSNIGDNLEHCDVPFYQKVTFTRVENEDHTASTGTLIISDSNLYLLPEQDVLVNNDLEAMSVTGTAFNFGDATIGIDEANACKPADSTTSAFVDCGGAKAFIKPFQREEPITISFKSTSALQMQSVTLKTFDDSEMTVDGNTVCTLNQGSTTDGTYGPNSKKCTVETFYAPGDVNWKYADPDYEGHTPSRAYSFTFLGASGPLAQAYTYYDDDNLVLNVIVETTVSQAGARPGSRRRLGAASSIQLIGDNSRSLRLLAEDSRSAETVVLSLPVLPMMDGGGGGGLGGLSVGSSNSKNGTVLTIPQTIINQYHTTHNDGESAGTISLVLSAVAVTLVVSGMAVWGIRRFQSSKAHKSGASSDHGMKVSSESQSYGESTPMLSMRGLHVA